MNAPIDPQTTWDREDALYRLRRLQHLRVQLADAEQAVTARRSEYARAVAEETRLRAELYAALEVETTPDLFTPRGQERPQEEPDPAIRCSYHDLHGRQCCMLSGHRDEHYFPVSDSGNLPPSPPAIETHLETLLEASSDADAEEQALPPEPPEGHPWPDWLTAEVLQAAYLGQAKFKSGKLARLEPFNWAGQLWVVSGIFCGGNYDEARLLLLTTPEAFAERWPGTPPRLEPGPLHSDAAPVEQVEDRLLLQWYTGVRLRVGRKEYVIAPAGEGRTVVRRKETS